jgi:hypothetical protein
MFHSVSQSLILNKRIFVFSAELLSSRKHVCLASYITKYFTPTNQELNPGVQCGNGKSEFQCTCGRGISRIHSYTRGA